MIPWIATIDAFQHWVYTNPAHSREDARRQWLDLDDRFGRRSTGAGWSSTAR